MKNQILKTQTQKDKNDISQTCHPECNEGSLARDSSLALLVQNDRAYRFLHIAVFVFGFWYLIFN